MFLIRLKFKEFCKSKDLVVSGKKQDLIARISRFNTDSLNENDKKKTTLNTNTNTKMKRSPPTILTRIKQAKTEFKTYKKDDTKFIEVENDTFVVNDSGKIYKHLKDGNQEDLCDDIIQLLDKYRLPYIDQDNIKPQKINHIEEEVLHTHKLLRKRRK